MMKILKMGEVSAAEIFRRNTPTVNVTDTVAEILRQVRKRGDAALKEYTKKFDGADLDSLLVTEAEMEEALTCVEPEFLRVLEKAAARQPNLSKSRKSMPRINPASICPAGN